MLILVTKLQTTGTDVPVISAKYVCYFAFLNLRNLRIVNRTLFLTIVNREVNPKHPVTLSFLGDRNIVVQLPDAETTIQEAESLVGCNNIEAEREFSLQDQSEEDIEIVLGIENDCEIGLEDEFFNGISSDENEYLSDQYDEYEHDVSDDSTNEAEEYIFDGSNITVTDFSYLFVIFASKHALPDNVKKSLLEL